MESSSAWAHGLAGAIATGGVAIASSALVVEGIPVDFMVIREAAVTQVGLAMPLVQVPPHARAIQRIVDERAAHRQHARATEAAMQEVPMLHQPTVAHLTPHPTPQRRVVVHRVAVDRMAEEAAHAATDTANHNR
jgi:hypothetical protein